jgi:uncharacterized protein (TIGR02265 family)
MSNELGGGNAPPYEVEQDLEQRLRLATPEHTTRGLLFTATLNMVRELGGDEALVRQCQEASGEKEFLDFFHYPTSSLLRLLAAAARGLSGRYGGIEEALRQLGRKSAERYMGSVVGMSAHVMTAMDPSHWVTALQQIYKFLMPYAEPKVLLQERKRGILAIKSTFTPLPYHEGGVLAVAERLGLKNVKVRARGTGALSIELDLSRE